MCGDPAFEEPVFVFFPNGRIRAACFDPNKAWWDPATEEPFLFFEGADHVPEVPPVNAVDVQFETASRAGLYVIAGSWPARACSGADGPPYTNWGKCATILWTTRPSGTAALA
jgi:hypothetical protein